MTTENTPIFSVAKYSSIQPAIDAGTLKYPAYILVRDGDDWTWAFVDKDSTIKRVKGYQQEAVIVVDTLPMENVRTDVFYFCNDIGYLYINGSFVPVFQDVTAVEAKVEANTNAISNLDSAVNTRIASAKTELESKITTAQDTLQATIDAVDEKANTNATAIGDLDDLGTTQKGDLVAAINEVKASVSTGGGAVSDEQIAEAVYNYLLENPIEGVTDEQVAQAVSEYMVENPIETGATSWNDLEDRPFYSYEDYYLLFSEQGLGGRLNILGEMMVRLPGNSAVIRVYDTATGDLLYEDIFDKQTVSLKFEGYNITWYGNGKLANDFDEFVGNNLGIGEEKYTEGKVVLYRVIDDNVDSKLDEWRFVIDDSVEYMSKYGAMDIEVLDINKETKYATLDENFIPDTIARKSDIPIVDEALYESSPNPVQNKVVAKKFSELSDTVNNKLDSSKLTEAIDTALTQAKESGEFKGDKGDKGDDGKSAYEYAKDGGYTGTEEEFAKKLAQENPTREEFSQLQDTINNLPSSGGNGLSANAITLLITILKDCFTNTNQLSNINALETALKQNTSSGDNEEDTPTSPTTGVSQSGSILTIISDVTVTQTGSTLAIA